MEIECILLCLLLSVSSIAFNHSVLYAPINNISLFRFSFFYALAMKLCHRVKTVKKKQTKNSQCQPIRPDKLQQTYNCFNSCGRHLSPPLIALNPSTCASPFLNCIITRSSCLHQCHKKNMNDWTWISKRVAFRVCQ